MILTPHAIVGATLANMFPDNPALGFSLAFVSHYVLDILPHTEYDISSFIDTKNKKIKSVFKESKSVLYLLPVILDIICAVLLCFIIFVRNKQSLFITLVGITGGLLPDFFQFLYLKFKNKPLVFFQKIHDKFHALIKVKNKKFWGTLFQIVIPIFVLFLYFCIKSKNL